MCSNVIFQSLFFIHHWSSFSMRNTTFCLSGVSALCLHIVRIEIEHGLACRLLSSDASTAVRWRHYSPVLSAYHILLSYNAKKRIETKDQKKEEEESQKGKQTRYIESAWGSIKYEQLMKRKERKKRWGSGPGSTSGPDVFTDRHTILIAEHRIRKQRDAN